MIRKPTSADVDQIVDCIDGLKSGSPWSDSVVNRGNVELLIAADDTKVFFRVVDIDGLIVGLMIGVMCAQILSSEIDAYEQSLFIRPESRGSGAAVRLVREFEKWAIENKAKRIWIGQSVGHEIEKTSDFYKRLGFSIVGFNGVKKGV